MVHVTKLLVAAFLDSTLRLILCRLMASLVTNVKEITSRSGNLKTISVMQWATFYEHSYLKSRLQTLSTHGLRNLDTYSLRIYYTIIS